MKIDGKTLTGTDVGRRVRYTPLHAKESMKPTPSLHPDIEEGLITSWNALYVFVDYGHGSHPATSPDDLQFIP